MAAFSDKELRLHEKLSMSNHGLNPSTLVSELRGQDDAAEQRLPRHRGQLMEGPVHGCLQRGGRYGNFTLFEMN